MITTNTITKTTIAVQKSQVIDNYAYNMFDHINNDLTYSDPEFPYDLISLAEDLKKMQGNKFAQFFRDGSTMLMLDSEGMDLIEKSGNDEEFMFEIVVKDGDKVVETIPGKEVSW